MSVYVTASIYALAGFAILGHQGRLLRREIASLRWPRAAGQVIDASRRAVVVRGRHGPWLADVEPEVLAEYEVDGTTYRTRELRWAGLPAWAVTRTLARYHVGRRVEVAYDPSHPSVGVLEPGPTLLRLVSVAFGVACVLGGIVWLWTAEST